jgi:hypothetical protein
MADITPLSGNTEAVATLPSQFIDKANIFGLWTGLAYPITDYEDALYWIQTAYTLDQGAGVQLDYLGQILNQPRLGGPYPVGEPDADYVLKLRAAVLRNRSMGSAPELIAIFAALLGANYVGSQIFDTPPAAFVAAIWVSAALTPTEEQILGEFCDAARAAGVGIRGLAWYTEPTFAFDGFPFPPFAGYDDGSGTVGGYYAKYFWP